MNNRFLNTYEQATFGKLIAVTDKDGAYVLAKVRLADVIPINNSGISDAEFRFATQSHIDFVVLDAECIAQFCVEFDGPGHRRPEQANRDKIKDGLLTRFGMPFVRINAMYLNDRFRGLDLLTYFVDAWFLWVAFNKAQTAGLVPYDEPFDPTFIYSRGTLDEVPWPYWLSIERQQEIKKLYEAKRVAQMLPGHWIGEDETGKLHGISWLFVNSTSCIYVETTMLAHQFPPVCGSDVLSQITVFDLYDRLTAVLRGQCRCRNPQQLNERIRFYESHYHFLSCLTCPPRAG